MRKLMQLSGSSIENRIFKSVLALLLFSTFFFQIQNVSGAEPPALTLITANDDGSEYGVSLQILVLMTMLSLIPSMVILMTSFTRIIIVLSLLRQALGVGSTPPNQVLVGIAIFLSFFVMKPVFDQVYESAYLPVESNEISFQEGLEKAMPPIKNFMLSQVREKDLLMFMEMAEEESVENEMSNCWLFWSVMVV